MGKHKKLNRKIKILVFADSPACSTGFACVTRGIFTSLAKSGKYEIDIIGVNDRGGWKDPSKYPFKIYPARVGIQEGSDYYGRPRLISSLLGQDPDLKPPWDIVFTLNDPFILEQPVPVFGKGTLRVIKETQKAWKEKADPRAWFKTVAYWPVDSELKGNWINEAIALPDVSVMYTRYGKQMVEKADNAQNKPVGIGKKLKIIYHGVNLDTFKAVSPKVIVEFRKKFFEGRVKKETFLISVVARNQLRKDLPRTLQIFSEFIKRRPDAFLYLNCKETDAWGSLREYARNWPYLKFAENWGVPGGFSPNFGLPIEVLNVIYQASDCILSTSLGEGFGFYNLEGFATKTVVVAPNNTCYSDDTRVFTLNGIKNYMDVKKGDLVWSFNTKSKAMEAKRVLKIMQYDYDGEMIHLKSKKADLLVTPNHKILLKKRYGNSYEYRRADSLPSQFNLPMTAKWMGKIPSKKLLLEQNQHGNANKLESISILNFLKLAGWYLAEGTLTQDKKCHKTTRVALYEPEKGRYRKKVEKLLTDIGVTFSSTFKKDGLRFSNYGIYRLLLQFGRGSKNKKIPRWILDLDKPHLKILFNALMEGDGATANNVNYKKVYVTVSQKLAENFSELAFKLGFNPKIILTRSKGSFIGKRKIVGGNAYRIILRKTTGCLKKYRNNIVKERYKRKVWCFEIEDNNNFLVGRNNLFTFCGNSHPELFNYDAKEDISDMDNLYKNKKVRGVPIKCGVNIGDWATYGAQDWERIRPLTNVDDAVKKLIWVYDNQDKVKEITDRAHDWIQNYSWELIAKQWDKIFSQVYDELKDERTKARVAAVAKALPPPEKPK